MNKNKTWIKNGIVITPEKLIYGGGIVIDGSKISAVLEAGECLQGYDSENNTCEFDEIDAGGLYISPGFVDIHVHGGGGFEVMNSSPDEICKICEAHARHGTTSILPTTFAAPIEMTAKTLDNITEAQKICECSNISNILGIHMEGPFLSAKQCGAQPVEYMLEPSEENISYLLDGRDNILMMGAAPEIPSGNALGKKLQKRGITASISHSDADFDEVSEAIKNGYTDVTHIYSGCSSLHRINGYRIAGVVEAGLYYDDLTVQVIADGKHLPASLLKFIYKCKGADRISLITDGLALSATDAEDGTIYTQCNGVQAILEDGIMKMPDRTGFAGSIATTSRLVRNMIELADVPLIEAVKMASVNPLKTVNMSKNKGQIIQGFDADIILFDNLINVCFTMVMGHIMYDERKR